MSDKDFLEEAEKEKKELEESMVESFRQRDERKLKERVAELENSLSIALEINDGYQRKLKKETERVDELRRQLDSGMIRPFTSKEEKILQVGLTLGQKEMVLKNQLERGK